MTKPTKSTKPVKKHTSEFKCKVAIESFTKDDVAGVARKHGVHPNQLSTWRKDMKDNGHLATTWQERVAPWHLKTVTVSLKVG